MSNPTPPRPDDGAPPGSGGEPSHRYTAALAAAIETHWQRCWDDERINQQPNPGDDGFEDWRPKFYCLDMFPYPSGSGLHVGHPEGYTASDILCRYKRMRGFNVLHPMGWDAFGLPAEQYAIQTGVHPATTTRASIETFRRQLKRFGFSYDWSRELGTIDEDYYRWTQWIFLQIYNAWFDEQSPSRAGGPPGRARPIADLIGALESGEFLVGGDGGLVRSAGTLTGPIGGAPVGTRRWHELAQAERREFIDARRLAYVGEVTVNWCPALGTVLANDEVIDGRSERGGHPVVRRPLRQWMFRITAHAERLLAALDELDWPASTRTMQTEWIGRSVGAEIRFEIVGGGTLTVFTTRPDTLFGATYMVVAPEHPLVGAVLAAAPESTERERLREYAQAARNRSDVERQEAREKTGVPLGVLCINPATNEPIPVWCADYVLMGYGFGAIMAVPAHDERDFEFARRFGLPMRMVVWPGTEAPAEFWNLVEEKFGSQDYYSAVWVPPIHAPIAIDGMLAALDGVPGARDAVEVSALADGGWCILVRPPLEDVVIAHLPSPVYQFELGQARPDPGIARNSTGPELTIDSLPTDQAKAAVVAWLERTGRGGARTTYRLRDWTFSRQRYWGEPIPVVFDEQGNHYPIREDRLPVTLPPLDDYAPVESPDPRPLLAKAESWVRTTAGEAGVDPALLRPETPVLREANTMPGSAGSSWYAIRYCDPGNQDRLVGREAEAYWMGGDAPGVDLYIGGAEHAVGHLLYARWWQNVLFDLGHVSTPEPFRRLFHQGLITAHAYQRADKTLVPSDEVWELPAPPADASDGGFAEARPALGGPTISIDRASLPEPVAAALRRGQGAFVHAGPEADPAAWKIRDLTPVAQITAKMSKSLKNVVNPDDVIAEYGADTFRLYEMYMGPLEMSKPWNPRDIVGLHRFLQRAWRLAIDERTGDISAADAPDPAVERLLHRTIHRVAQDLERLAFNTAIAALIEFVNNAGKGAAETRPGGPAPRGVLTRDQIARLALCLAPLAPHLAEELWHRLGLRAATGSIARQPWPSVDEAMLKDDQVEIAVQLSGKLKAKVTVPADAPGDQIQALVMAHPDVAAILAGKDIKKVVVVPGRLVNIVAV